MLMYIIGEGIDFAVVNETLELDELCVPVNITIMDDMDYEDNETFIILATQKDSLSSTENNASATITVLDDESKSKEPLQMPNNLTVCAII